MADRIDVNSIIDPKVKKELISIQNEMKKLVDMTKQLASTSKQLDTELKKGAQTQQQVSNARKTAATNTKKLSDVEKEIEKIEQQHYNILTKMVAERSEENKVLERAKQKRAAENKEIKQTIALEKTEANSIARLTAENKKLISERNKLNTSTKEGQKRIMEINSQLDRNNKTIKENSSALEKQKNNVGNYKSALQGAWRSILAVTGVTIGLQGAKKLLGSIIQSTKTSNDAWTASLHAASNAFDVLKKSIATGNLSGLIQRMRDAAQAGREYANSMAELGDRLRAYNLQEAEARAETDLLREKLTDESLTIKERIAVGNQLIQSEKNLLELRKQILTDISDAEIKDLSSKINLSEEQLKTMLKEYNLTNDIREQASKYLNEEIKLEKEIRDIRKQAGLAAAGAPATARAGIQESFNKQIEKANKQFEEYNKSIDNNVKIYAELLKRYSSAADEELDKVVQALIQVAEAESEYASRSRRIITQIQRLQEEERRAMEALARVMPDTYKELSKVIDSYAKDALAVEENLKNEQIDIFEEVSDAQEQELQARIEANKVAIEKIMQYERQLRDLKISAINEGFEFYNAIQQRELENLEAKKEREIALAGESTTARELIETQYANKIADIKRKQAIADKLQAIFNIGLDTAQAIIGFLANPGGIIGTNLSIAAGVIGGIQLATVLAQPIPKFYKGVENFTGGLATVGEQGSELIETPTGVMLSPDRATTMMLPKGTNVYTKDETKAIIQNSNIDVSEMVKEQKLTRKALTNKTEHNTSITDKGMKYMIRKNNQRTVFIDKYIRS